ncbi:MULTISPECIES: TonB-dependent receptor [unclassified Azospirillum]|uniref:TonB-dependent receptor n=1 Tax=unclassified Azospirillum TaxID=2630922 RepID=UPI000B75027E|nr:MULTISPECIES: TonB-dependent receptor [unclassified Azospirillum]SNS45820.1 iron complex outermembrane recepter protein [Azospirillum sp. RU38E]SNS64893.1 iron complex outermembrane recepter protein [Azospirillum sp. RU37A]
MTRGRNTRTHRLALATAGSLLALLALPAAAQDQIEEIIVTAQKRSENVQDVPIAVSAFSAEALETKGITDVQNIAAIAPNINLDAGSPFSGSPSVLSASIRGIGQDDFAFNLDPGVGVYVDGVYLARTTGANADLMDVGHIEVLKGPQGTLFGRNTIGGAISIVTRQPAEQFGATASVTGGSLNRFDVGVAADVPLTDTLFSSWAFSSKKRDGYLKVEKFPGTAGTVTDLTPLNRAGSGTSDRQGNIDSHTARGKLFWKGNGSVTNTLSFDYTRDRSTTTNNLLATNPAGGLLAIYNLCVSNPAPVIAAISAAPGNPNFTNACVVPRAVVGTPLTGAGTRLPYDNRFLTKDIDKTYGSNLSFSRLQTFGFTNTLDWDIDDDMGLKSITSYRRLLWSAGLDADGSPLNMADLSFTMKQYQLSQELQLTGTAFSDKLHYVYGLYYFNEGGSLHDFVTFNEGLLQLDGPNVLETSSAAAYTHLNYKLTDKLGLTVGARYTWEHKTFEGAQSDLNALNYKLSGCYPVSEACRVALGFPVPGEPLRYYPAGENEKTYYIFTPRLGAEYHITDDVMGYGSWSKGFKSGGWTTRLSNPLSTAPGFGPEKAETFELGVKSELLDRRLRLNVAGFRTDYSGIQLNFQEGVSPTLRNAGEARIWGGEAEFQALLGNGFTLDGTLGYLHARYQEVDPGALGVTLDSRLPKTPTLKFSLSPSYTADLPNDATLRFGVDYTHTGAMYNDSANTELLRRPSIDMVNLSVTYTAPDGRWSATVGGTNITDERYLTTGNQNDAAGATFGSYNAPAQWYATLKYKY